MVLVVGACCRHVVAVLSVLHCRFDRAERERSESGGLRTSSESDGWMNESRSSNEKILAIYLHATDCKKLRYNIA